MTMKLLESAAEVVSELGELAKITDCQYDLQESKSTADSIFCLHVFHEKYVKDYYAFAVGFVDKVFDILQSCHGTAWKMTRT